MDEFERQDILEEFLVRWHGGHSIRMITDELVKSGRNANDVTACKRIFEIWTKSRRPWSAIKRVKLEMKSGSF